MLGAARLALLPGGDRAAAVAAWDAYGAKLEPAQRAQALHLLWRITGERAHLAEAKRMLDHLVAHAPPVRRGAMVANVRAHREIAEAARAAGI